MHDVLCEIFETAAKVVIVALSKLNVFARLYVALHLHPVPPQSVRGEAGALLHRSDVVRSHGDVGRALEGECHAPHGSSIYRIIRGRKVLILVVVVVMVGQCKDGGR